MEQSISPWVLTKIAMEFFEEFERRFGEHIHILDWSLHLDEATPHIHERHVFDCENRYGEIEPKQGKALEALGFDLPHPDQKAGKKSMKKFKDRLREYSSRKRCQSIRLSLAKIKVYVRGWMNYYGTTSMKTPIDDLNGWLYRRIRMCIWKQWQLPRTKKRHLISLRIPNTLRAWRQTVGQATGERSTRQR